MKYSFMTFSCPQLTLQECLDLAKRLGYDGIEPRIDNGHKHGLERFSSPQLRQEAFALSKKTGIAICCIATSCTYADPTTTEKQVQVTLEAIDLASDLGAPTIRVFGGKFPDDLTRDQAKDLLVDALSSVADHAGQKNVTVCIETHDFWCNPQDLADVVSRVNHPNVAVNWDIMHPVRTAGVSMDEAFETLRPWIRHVHFHDGHRREAKPMLCPIGEGEIDHQRAVSLLLSIPYDGFLSGEWIGWEPYETHLPRELATMKNYEKA